VDEVIGSKKRSNGVNGDEVRFRLPAYSRLESGDETPNTQVAEQAACCLCVSGFIPAFARAARPKPDRTLSVSVYASTGEMRPSFPSLAPVLRL